MVSKPRILIAFRAVDASASSFSRIFETNHREIISPHFLKENKKSLPGSWEALDFPEDFRLYLWDLQDLTRHNEAGIISDYIFVGLVDDHPFLFDSRTIVLQR